MTKSIVLEVCRECKVHPKEFFGGERSGRVVRARRVAIWRLRSGGFCMAAIARMIRRDRATVAYWLKPEFRKKHMAVKRALMARKRAA